MGLCERLKSDVGPAPDRRVERELRKLDPGLYVIWRNLRVDRSTGGPLIVQGKNGEPGPMPYPRWHVCLRNQYGNDILFTVQTEDKEFRPIDMRVVYQIRDDVARHMSVDEIDEMFTKEADASRAAQAQKAEDDASDFAEANKRKIAQVFEGDNIKDTRTDGNKRDAKIFSYKGKGNHTSGRDCIERTDKESDWDLPESFKKRSEL